MTHLRGLFVLVTLLLVLPASAHDLWIEPSTFRPAPGTEVKIALLVGQKLRGESLPRNSVLLDRFVLKGRGAETPVGGEEDDDPAGSVRVSDPGLHWIGYQSYPYPVTLEAGKFEAYLKDEGLERVVEERARSGKSSVDGRERFYRCAKSLVDVSRKGPKSATRSVFDSPLGFTLEIVPLKNPYALSPGGELPVSVSFRGKPIANILVAAINKADPDRSVSARTDAKGLVKVKLSRPGFWLIKAVHMLAAPPGAGVDWESWWASMTFDLASSSGK
jgi:uncharacterized GH25 family protein